MWFQTTNCVLILVNGIFAVGSVTVTSSVQFSIMWYSSVECQYLALCKLALVRGFFKTWSNWSPYNERCTGKLCLEFLLYFVNLKSCVWSAVYKIANFKLVEYRKLFKIVFKHIAEVPLDANTWVLYQPFIALGDLRGHLLPEECSRLLPWIIIWASHLAWWFFMYFTG